MISARFPSVLALLSTCSACVTLSIAAEPTSRAAGEPAVSGMEPGKQGEKDWVDNRWQKSDLGPFLASTLPTPAGSVARGLSIRLGTAAAVGYDTKSATFRLGWTGDFLKLSPSRFGLIEPPRPAGTIQTASGPGPGWPGAQVRFHAIHIQGSATTLEYQINNTRVLERPSFAVVQGGAEFTRSFIIDPHETPLTLIGAWGVPGAGGGVESRPQLLRARWTKDLSMTIATAVFDGSVKADLKEAQWSLQLPASTQVQRLDIRLWAGSVTEAASYASGVRATAHQEKADAWLAPGPSRWNAELTTKGERGRDDGFLAVDTLTLPYQNPWNALFFGSGVDFDSQGAGYLCTIHGDVWKVTGIDHDLRALRWHRYATGLFQPLGLKVRGDRVYVLGRDHITRLQDLNGDDEADVYENFFDGIDTSTGGHDYVTCLETDSVGNFYYTDPKGVHRVSADGKTKTTLATGWRNPNGMGVSPDGKIITVAPQQGTWTPSSLITEVREGGYYGYGGPKVSAERPAGYDPHLCWIPHGVDNSSGSQAWIPKDTWGPLGGQMLHLLWGRCSMMLVLRDTHGGVSQGATVPLPARFLSGPNRATFNPVDQSLYVAGSTGWQTSAAKDGALQRVRYVRDPDLLPIGWKASGNGVELTFNRPLETSAATDPGSFAVKQWNYRYSQDYGSKDWSAADPSKEGRDEVEVRKVSLSSDRKTLRLEFQSLQPVMQGEIKYNLAPESGKAARGQVWFTVNHAVP